jgi:hypothetical protein
MESQKRRFADKPPRVHKQIERERAEALAQVRRNERAGKPPDLLFEVFEWRETTTKWQAWVLIELAFRQGEDGAPVTASLDELRQRYRMSRKKTAEAIEQLIALKHLARDAQGRYTVLRPWVEQQADT